MDCWDFGPTPQKHCSYSYHSPFGGYGLTSSDDPGMAVAGDPNPWQKSSGFKARPNSPDWSNFDPGSDRARIRWGNARTHQEDGQNVLYLDGACGVRQDVRVRAG